MSRNFIRDSRLRDAGAKTTLAVKNVALLESKRDMRIFLDKFY